MPRQKLSEFRAKTIISDALDRSYSGWPINSYNSLDSQLEAVASDVDGFVVKVDEGIKGRFKKGLVKLDVKRDGLADAVQELSSKGYHWFIIEPMVSHESSSERYISLTSDREGLILNYTASGGVDVEAHADQIQHVRLGGNVDWAKLANETGFTNDQLQTLVQVFNDNFFVFLEINPYVAEGENLQILDAAVEVDDAGMFFVNSWQADDFRRHTKLDLTEQEKLIEELDANSPASLKLSVLEPNGSIFLLLSGGGASVVVADEIYNQGYGKQLANYGEYSGNPNAEETYAYTRAILDLLLESSAKHKVVFVGGAVANFTDVAKTFAGLIKAINEVADQLKQQGVKIFVRRGGPNQETGLAMMKATLEKHGLLGAVHDPSTPLTEAVAEALKEVPHD